ncbi:MAG: hypothetical protein SAJ12_04445 [Jaaginema sp. PMC 1079.18]|nr:hypothetical protein [Jaaginema sp. PMC 1080.18]MEC4850240.1 hypothetical protein [Jaaginema sp. PMC 1079.18]MEC4867296.1 hypothetical protein [Jaaginema sp. PMC 1078.18]
MVTSWEYQPESHNEQEHLNQLEEISFEQWVKKHDIQEAYRFTYLPTFDPPETIRIGCTNADPPQAVFKVGNAPDSPVPGSLAHEITWTPSSVAWTLLTRSIEKHFWLPPTWKGEVNRDGSEWLFEGYRHNQYKQLKSWCGRNPHATALGQAFREFMSDRQIDNDNFIFFRGVKGDRLGHIIYDYLEDERYIQALQLAESHKSDYIKTWVLEDRIFESWPEFSRALQLEILVQATITAHSIASNLRKAPILRNICLKYASVGQLNRSLQVAYSIPVPYYQAITLDYLCQQYEIVNRTEIVADIRSRLIQVACQVQNEAQLDHLKNIVQKHSKLERLDRKISRLMTSWLSVKFPS